MEYRIVVADDQPQDRDRLARDLKDWFSGRAEARVEAFPDGASLLAETAPGSAQIAFLDIRMEGMDGITLAKRLRQNDAQLLIIFLTSAREYAFDAFPIHPFDYLVKPYSANDLSRVLEDALRALTGEEPEITLRVSRVPVTVPCSRILSASSRGHTVDVTTADGNVLSAAVSFTDFLNMLEGDERFLVCNRGLVVNMDHVLTLDEDVLRMTDGSVCPLKTKGRGELIARFTRYQISRLKRGAR